MDNSSETMSSFRENKSYCSCSWIRDKELACTCGESDRALAWKWDENAKTSSAILADDGQRVYFHKGYSIGNACVRGDTPLVLGNDYYWEIRMLSAVYGTSMMIGIGTENFDINQSNDEFCNLLGSDEESWGMKFDGKLFHNNKSFEYNSAAGFSMGSIIGIHLDMWNGTLEFYLNRVPLGVAFHGLRNKILYPVLSSTAAHSIMKLIFAHTEPYSLSLMSAKLLNPPLIGHLPPALKSYVRCGWWLFPKHNRARADANSRKLELLSQAHGIYAFIDSDEEDDDGNISSCNILTKRMKRVLEYSRHRHITLRPEQNAETSQCRTTHANLPGGRPIRFSRHRTRPWMDY